jgi:peptidyl-prolyl cis-trans isomerase SurA
MLKNKFAFALILLLTTLTINTPSYAAPQEQALDKVIAVVNDDIITGSQLDREVKMMKGRMAAQSNAQMPPEAAFRKQVLNQLINRKIQLQMANRLNIQITDTELKKALNNIAKQNQTLLSNLAQFAKKQGLSLEGFHKESRNELLLQKLQQNQVAAHIVVTPEEVSELMHSKNWISHDPHVYHVKDILIELPTNPTPEQIKKTRQKAEVLLVKLRTVANFDKTAIGNSDNANAFVAGDLGWRKLPELPNAFTTVITKMKTGTIEGPIRTPNGFHLIKLIATKELTLKETLPKNPKARQHMAGMMVFQKKYSEALEAWLRKIRHEAYVKVI